MSIDLLIKVIGITTLVYITYRYHIAYLKYKRGFRHGYEIGLTQGKAAVQQLHETPNGIQAYVICQAEYPPKEELK